MNVPIIISGGGIIGNYISVRLKRHNIESLIIEKSSEPKIILQALELLHSIIIRCLYCRRKK